MTTTETAAHDRDAVEWVVITDDYEDYDGMTDARLANEGVHTFAEASDIADGFSLEPIVVHVSRVPHLVGAADPAAAVTDTERERAITHQCARVDVIEAWAREIDEDFAHRGADARGVIRRVEAAWGWSIPGEDDGPVALACYARDLFNAVAEHADDIAGSHDHDPRNARRYGWDCALLVPASLA